MAFNDMESGNPFGGSDFNESSSNNLKTLLISTTTDGYKMAITTLAKSLGTFQQHIDKASHLSKRVGTNRDNQHIRDQIHNHIDQGRSLTSTITVQLKDFLRFVSEVSGSERSKRRSQHKKLVKDFQQQVAGFETVAREFLQREQEFRRRLSSDANDPEGHQRGFSAFDTGNEWGSLGGGGGGGGGYQNTGDEEPAMTQEEKAAHQQLVQQELNVNEAMIQERKEEMVHVHENISLVNDIFKDLAGMVEDQGEQIEQIRGDLQFANKKTEAGVQELNKANDYQKASTKKLACCGIFIFVVVVVVVLIELIDKPH